MTKKQKKVLIRIIISIIFMIVLNFIQVSGYVRFVLYMIPYLIIGYDILRKAFKGIIKGQVFDENFLMAVATVGAIIIGEYTEGTAVMLFYQIGELFQSYAVGKSRRNISELMDIRPDYANIMQDDKLVKVDLLHILFLHLIQYIYLIPLQILFHNLNQRLNHPCFLY